MEMLIVVTIIGLMIGISFPSVSAGLDGIRLKSAADSTTSFLNSAMNRAERRQQAMQVILSPKENSIQVYSNDPGFARKLEMPSGISIAGDEPREFMLMPGGTVPRITIDLVNHRGAHKLVRLDPITGVPEVLPQ
jgi:type II secretory pathway pseudopilin PulG